MKTKILSFLIICLTTPAFAQRDFASLVNPFIGTGGHGHTFPGACSPFGMVQLSPDTRKEGWDGCGGYHYTDTTIHGFSHTHLSGTGISDYSDLLLLPLLGEHEIKEDESYAIPFSHKNEVAYASYYENYFFNNQVKVQLTTTKRSGFHKYTFPKKNGVKSILVDLDYRDQLLDLEFNVIDNHILSGTRVSRAWAKEQHFSFYMEFSEDILSVERIGESNKYILHFKPKTQEILVKVGVSAVDQNGAKNNLHKEIATWNFEEICNRSKAAWNNELSKIDVFNENKTLDTIFYTALYHSFIAPNLYSDVDGRYRGTDLKIHQSKDSLNQYTVFSLWDTFRATHPLYNLVQRQKNREFIQSFLNQYLDGGKLPMWELSGNYTSCMIGYHAVPVIVDAYFKGITDFDTDLALEAMIATSTADELGKHAFINKGVIYQEDEAESVSKTLEYAYDDWCIAKFAEAIGKADIAEEYYKRSLNYRNQFNPVNKFMQPKSNGAFVKNFYPSEVNFNYTEANSWQYSLFAPHDIGGLKTLLGGDSELDLWLDKLFNEKSSLSGRHQVDITGLIGQYAHGNEPSHHMAYLYNYAGESSKTTSMIHKILMEQYSNLPDGLSGNEDCGQMSSWYVLSALGMYSVAPGNDYYDLTTPLVDSAIIHLENGNRMNIKKDFSINKEGISFNGKELSNLSLKMVDINKGGELVFYKSLGKLKAPTAIVKDVNFVANPYFVNNNKSFLDSAFIELASLEKQPIYYTITGDTTTHKYIKGFWIKESKDINAYSKVVIDGKEVKSKLVNASYSLLNNNYSYSLLTEYDNLYNGNSDIALMDGVIGNKNYRSGLYQGFQGKDIEITIDAGSAKFIDSIGISCLSYMNAWIFYPNSVEVSYYNAKGEEIGDTYKEVLTKTDESKNNIEEKKIITLPVNEEVKSLKIKINNFGTCPDWHLSPGGKTWLFIDEIMIYQ